MKFTFCIYPFWFGKKTELTRPRYSIIVSFFIIYSKQIATYFYSIIFVDIINKRDCI